MEIETLGERIRRLRESRRWTQDHMAELLAVSAKTVSNWESGRNSPRNSMGALRELFGDALDGGAPAEETGDAVEVAIKQSELIDWRQDEVRSVYRRNLHEQRGEVKGA